MFMLFTTQLFRNPAFPFSDTFQVIRTPFSMLSNPELPLQEWFAHLFVLEGKEGLHFCYDTQSVRHLLFFKKGYSLRFGILQNIIFLKIFSG